MWHSEGTKKKWFWIEKEDNYLLRFRIVFCVDSKIWQESLSNSKNKYKILDNENIQMEVW